VTGPARAVKIFINMSNMESRREREAFPSVCGGEP